MKPLDLVLSKLEGVKKQGKGFIAHCPAHTDKVSSLSVTDKDSKVLLHCHAGCEKANILASISLTFKDLYSDNGHKPSKQEPLQTYDYVDETGKLLYQVVRYPGKKFIHRQPDGNGGWIYNMQGVKRVPYNLPIVIATIKAGQPVYIVEGEQDADGLTSIGLTASCNSGGAGNWLDNFSDYFNDAEVVILPDNDQPGQEHALKVAKNLSGKAKAIKIVNLTGLKEKDDVSDWLNAGNTKQDLVNLVKATDEFHHHHTIGNSDVMTFDLLPIVDLSQLDEPEPMTFIVEDMLPDNYLSVIFGAGGMGKSYLALAIACCVATGTPFLGKQVVKSNVLYLDFELEVNEQTRRAFKVARGLGLERPPKGLFYLQPGCNENIPAKLNDLIKPLVTTIEANKIRLVIVDSAGMAVEGDTEKAKDIICLFQQLKSLNVTTLLIDHQSKVKQGEDYEKKTAFGSIYKTNIARSIFQLQVVDNQQGLVKAIIRHTKSNFTAKYEPIGLSMSFGAAFAVELDEQALTLAKQNKSDETWQEIIGAFIKLGGRATAKQIHETSGVHLGTVKNKIGEHKKKDIKETGEKEGRAPIYELIALPDSSSSRPISLRCDDDDNSSKSEAVNLLKQEFNAEEISEGMPF